MTNRTLPVRRNQVWQPEGFIHDGETFCWSCLPDKPTADPSRISEFIGFDHLRGESDSFSNCRVCSCFLAGNLTSAGVRHELDDLAAMVEMVRDGFHTQEWWWELMTNTPDDWYNGSPRIAYYLDKATVLLDYVHPPTYRPETRQALEQFLEYFTPPEESPPSP